MRKGTKSIDPLIKRLFPDFPLGIEDSEVEEIYRLSHEKFPDIMRKLLNSRKKIWNVF